MARERAPSAPTQLALPLRQPAAVGFDGFVDDGNVEVLAALRLWCAGRGERYLLIHGAAGSGKSHLLQAAAGETARRGEAVVYLPLDRGELAPAALDDLDGRDAVVIDAVDAVAGQADWELALFRLWNRLAEGRRRLLMGARLPPAHLPIGLADLRSRLAAGPAYAVLPLDDAGRARLLRLGAEQRGMRLGDAAVAYILTRCPRDPGWLNGLLDRLDAACLAARRAPTVPFVAEVIAATIAAPIAAPIAARINEVTAEAAAHGPEP